MPTIGRLTFEPVTGREDLVAPPVAAALVGPAAHVADQVTVAEIDPELADTAAFCDHHGIALEESANCVVVVGKRGGQTRMAACAVLATTRADVNNLVRRHLDVRKATFAAMDVAVSETGMEYGGISQIGLPPDWPLLVDTAVAAAPQVVIGSGLRRSKLALPGAALAALPNATVLESLGR